MYLIRVADTTKTPGTETRFSTTCIIVSCTVDPGVISKENGNAGIGRKGSTDLMLTSSDDDAVGGNKTTNHKISIMFFVKNCQFFTI